MIGTTSTARLSVLPLAVVEWGIVLWYFLYWDLFPKYSARRLIPWALFVLSVPAIVLLQIHIYKYIASVHRINDVVFKGALVFENAISVLLLFMILKRRKKHHSHQKLD